VIVSPYKSLYLTFIFFDLLILAFISGTDKQYSVVKTSPSFAYIFGFTIAVKFDISSEGSKMMRFFLIPTCGAASPAPS